MYDVFYNDRAIDMIKWAIKQTDRVKQSRIFKVANQLEERYRKYHPNEVTSIYVKGMSVRTICMVETLRNGILGT